MFSVKWVCSMGTSVEPRRYRLNVGKAIAWALILCGAGFTTFSAVSIIDTVRTAIGWPRTHAIVVKTSVNGFGDDSFAVVSIEFVYESAGKNRYAWAYLSPPFHRQKILKRYAAGTAHMIYLNPKNHAVAEVGVGWNVDYLFVPVLTACIAGVLFWAALYFFRLEKRNL